MSNGHHNEMKKIKRTTIKIRQREMLIVSGSENDGNTKIHICPFCKFPFTSQSDLAQGLKPAELPEAKELNLNKTIF